MESINVCVSFNLTSERIGDGGKCVAACNYPCYITPERLTTLKTQLKNEMIEVFENWKVAAIILTQDDEPHVLISIPVTHDPEIIHVDIFPTVVELKTCMTPVTNGLSVIHNLLAPLLVNPTLLT